MIDDERARFSDPDIELGEIVHPEAPTPVMMGDPVPPPPPPPPPPPSGDDPIGRLR